MNISTIYSKGDVILENWFPPIQLCRIPGCICQFTLTTINGRFRNPQEMHNTYVTSLLFSVRLDFESLLRE